MALRRTAAKAFGSGDRPARERVPLADTLRSAALDRFVKELHAAIEEAAAAESAGGARGAEGSSLQLTKLKPLSEGVEFALAGQGTAIRFLDTLTGFVLVSVEREHGPREEEVISVAPHCGIYRPIVKPVPAAFGVRRAPFHFTSVRELARRYVQAAR
jgi:hypothetical protein